MDMLTAPDLEKAIAEAAKSTPSAVVVDMSDVEFLACHGNAAPRSPFGALQAEALDSTSGHPLGGGAPAPARDSVVAWTME